MKRVKNGQPLSGDENDVDDDLPPSQSHKSVRSAGLNSNKHMSAMVRRLLKARGVALPEDSKQNPLDGKGGKGHSEGGKGGKGSKEKGGRGKGKKGGSKEKIDLENPTVFGR